MTTPSTPSIPSIINFRKDMITLYTKQIDTYTQQNTVTGASFNKDKIQAMNNFVYFLTEVSDKEITKLVPIFLKFLKNTYISSFELKYIQTLYYNKIKYNSKYNARNSENNVAYLFGFVKEVKKGYNIDITINGKVENKSTPSEYILSSEDNDFLGEIISCIKNNFDGDTISKLQDKLLARSLKLFNNVEVQHIEPNKNYNTPHFFEEEKKKAIELIQNSTLLLQFPAKNPNGRVYNRYWQALSKEDKINLFPNYDSYDLDTAIYQFLYIKGCELNLPSEKIKHYTEQKGELRCFIPKKFFSAMPYKAEKNTTLEDILSDLINLPTLPKDPSHRDQIRDFILDLYLEIKPIVDAIIQESPGNRGSKLFYMYETWEKEVVSDFIRKNRLDSYITNHDEILVPKSVHIKYIPSYFGYESAEERQILAKKYNNTAIEDFIAKRDARIKEEERTGTLIHYHGVLKRTKNPIKRLGYFMKIESLKLSYDENFLTNSYSELGLSAI